MDVNEEVKLLCKFLKKKHSWGVQGECERRFEVFVKKQRKKNPGAGLGRGRFGFGGPGG